MRKSAAFWCTAVLALAAAIPAAAGSFSVTPTRIEFSGSKRTAVVTLTNADSVPLMVQTTGMAWSQSEGEDVYSESRELLVTPPVFTIPPKGEQIVRVALRGEAPSGREQPFRIFFQEVPQAAAADFTGLNIALRVAIPVFLKPAQPVAGKIEWTVQPGAGATWRVEAHNTGTQHVQVTDFDIDLGAPLDKIVVSVVKYVLSGSRVSWQFTPPPGAASGLKVARIRGSSDQGEFDSQAVIAPRR